MNVVVRLFGPEADVARRRQIAVAVDEPATCGAVRRRLAEAAPDLAPRLRDCRFAVNHRFVADDYRLREEDEVALIGLVSGG